MDGKCTKTDGDDDPLNRRRKSDCRGHTTSVGLYIDNHDISPVNGKSLAVIYFLQIP